MLADRVELEPELVGNLLARLPLPKELAYVTFARGELRIAILTYGFAISGCAFGRALLLEIANHPTGVVACVFPRVVDYEIARRWEGNFIYKGVLEEKPSPLH